MKNQTKKKNRKPKIVAFPLAAKKIPTKTTNNTAELTAITGVAGCASAGVSSAAKHRLSFDLFAKN